MTAFCFRAVRPETESVIYIRHEVDDSCLVMRGENVFVIDTSAWPDNPTGFWIVEYWPIYDGCEASDRAEFNHSETG